MYYGVGASGCRLARCRPMRRASLQRKNENGRGDADSRGVEPQARPGTKVPFFTHPSVRPANYSVFQSTSARRIVLVVHVTYAAGRSKDVLSNHRLIKRWGGFLFLHVMWLLLHLPSRDSLLLRPSRTLSRTHTRTLASSLSMHAP